MTDPGRTLALFDAENLLGNSPAGATIAEYEHALTNAIAHAELDTDDHLIVATGIGNPNAAFATHNVRPGAALLFGRGTNGADRALSAQLDNPHHLAERYTTIVIGSGDHHFTQHLINLNRTGLYTIALAWTHKLSNQIRLAANETRYLHRPTPTQHAHAA